MNQDKIKNLPKISEDLVIFIPDDHILSTQHIYGNFRGRTYMKKEGKDKKLYYSSIVSRYIKQPFNCPLEMEIYLFFPDKRRRDVDNYNKIILDSLTGIVYNDDSQLYKLTIEKVLDCKKDSGVGLRIKKYEENIY